MSTMPRLFSIVSLSVLLLFLTAVPALAGGGPIEPPPPAPQSVSLDACPRLHTINPNETCLVQITDWYGLDLATVAALNGIDPDAPLTTGDMICLSSIEPPPPAPQSVSLDACPRLHTINPNETRLVQITDWYGLDLATVAALNGIDPDAPLTTGDMICLSSIEPPPPAPQSVSLDACPRLHTINPNETRLAQITDWYGLDLATVAALNGIDPDAPLTTGDMICLVEPQSISLTPVQASDAEELPRSMPGQSVTTTGAINDAITDDGATPLHLAAFGGYTKDVTTLLTAGAQVNARTTDGITPLHVAAVVGHADVVQVLLAAGAQVDAQTTNGFTPLHEAARVGHADVVQVLLAAGAQVDAQITNNKTPLYLAAQEGHADVVQVLLAAGAQVDARATDGLTPLHMAANKGHAEVAQVLLAAGAQVDAQDAQYGLTPLHMAAIEGHAEVAQVLLAAGAQVDAQDAQYGLTPLHMAERLGYTEIVSILQAAAR